MCQINVRYKVVNWNTYVHLQSTSYLIRVNKSQDIIIQKEER